MFVSKKNGITMLTEYYERLRKIVVIARFLILQVCTEKCRVEHELEHKTSHSQEILYSYSTK